MKIRIKLPLKSSANDIYAGMHFSRRNKLKQDMYIIVNSQTKYRLPQRYSLTFDFYWRKNIPDADNNYLIAKMILDILSNGNDGWQANRGVTYISNRSVENYDYVDITAIDLTSSE